MEAIANGLARPARIAGKLGVDTALLASYLKRLQTLGYITRVEPLEPGGKGTSRNYWKIDDPYFRFWFR